jgi:hypothetical protein
MRPGFFLLAIGFASLLGAGVAAAGTLVQFPNLPGQTPTSLVGYLARPDTGLSLILGSGSADSSRHPAVVVLHRCSGFSSHSAAIADRLGSWGYGRNRWMPPTFFDIKPVIKKNAASPSSPVGAFPCSADLIP